MYIQNVQSFYQRRARLAWAFHRTNSELRKQCLIWQDDRLTQAAIDQGITQL